METYARIDGGIVVELFQTSGDMADMFYPSLVWVDITNVTPMPTYYWSATETDGTWSFAPGTAPAPW